MALAFVILAICWAMLGYETYPAEGWVIFGICGAFCLISALAVTVRGNVK